MSKAIKYLWAVFLLTFPFGVRFLIYENASYRFGNFNPWVSGFVYLPEVLLLLIFILWAWQKYKIQNEEFAIKARTTNQKSEIRNQKYKWLWIVFALFVANAFIITLLKGNSFLGAMFIFRLFEILVVMWLVADEILKPRKVITLLLIGLLIQVVWGFIQWQLNHSIGLTLLGESIISSDILGVAKNDLASGLKQIRAYGTFLHPNIFAGYLLVILFLAIKYLKSVSKIFWPAIIICGLYLTGSRAAMLVGLVGLLIYILEGQKFSLLRFFRSKTGRNAVVIFIATLLIVGNVWVFIKSDSVETVDASFKERLTQNVISKDMAKGRTFGVGINNFTLQMNSYSAKKLSPWEFQPVHNTYFLILNETGVQGLFLFIAFLIMLIGYYWKSGKVIPVLILLLLAPFDHFLWDSFVGMMLIGLVAGFFVAEGCLDIDSHD